MKSMQGLFKERVQMTYQQRMEFYAREAEKMKRKDYTEEIQRIREILSQAEYILIGAGAGLSAAGGLDYFNEEICQKEFPYLYRQGYRTLWQALWAPDRTQAQRWCMTAAEVLWGYYDFPPIPFYKQIYDWVKEKKYFVLTSNIDGQFLKNGFPEDHVFAPQESVHRLQCSRPCCRDIWEAEPVFRQIIAHLDEVHVSCPDAYLPRCPHCGAPAVQNMRGQNHFLPDEVMKNRLRMECFWKEMQSAHTVLWELGIGLNTPGLIRYPFQRITAQQETITLVRCNRDFPTVPPHIAHRTIRIGGELTDFFERLGSPE